MTRDELVVKILKLLARGPMTIDEIASVLGVDKKRVMRIIKELADKRIVKIENGRVVLVLPVKL